jgi:hypothetical protein
MINIRDVIVGKPFCPYTNGKIPCFIERLVEHFIRRIGESLADRISVIDHDLANFELFVFVPTFRFVSLKMFLRSQMRFHAFDQSQNPDKAQSVLIFFSGRS